MLFFSQQSGQFLVRFMNDSAGITETIAFEKCAGDIYKPKMNTVIMCHVEDKYVIGKLFFQKQQDMETNDAYHLVTLRGFTNKQERWFTEEQWNDFKSFAVEIN